MLPTNISGNVAELLVEVYALLSAGGKLTSWRPGIDIDHKDLIFDEVGARLLSELHESGRYDSVRTRYLKMDRKTEARAIRKLTAAPDFIPGSVNAVTEEGELLVTSASASQLAAYATGAGRLILVVGSQKIVRDLNAAMRRIRKHVFPYEDSRVREQLGMGSFIGKVLMITREWVEGRTTVILVREPVGI